MTVSYVADVPRFPWWDRELRQGYFAAVTQIISLTCHVILICNGTIYKNEAGFTGDQTGVTYFHW